MAEILAPAGSPESLTAAVRCGANAVYVGARRLSARQNARNFSEEELREAVLYCHQRDVRLYVTLNTLVSDSQFQEALSLARFCCEIGVDALIVQDLGLAAALRQCCPQMKLNASTQMSVHSPAGVRLLQDMGFSRVVLSRELSVAQIAQIAKTSGIELEVFVHGALCMCVSGQCYFSSMLGGRSGNRGLCAQTCRLPFTVDGKGEHALSLKDMSHIPYLRQLSAVGVTSFKIEGRMKRAEYVAAATKACALAAAGEPIPGGLQADLQSVFSRTGFTDGYAKGDTGDALFGYRQKEDVAAATGQVFAGLQKLYEKETPRFSVSMELTLQADRPAVLTAHDETGTVTVTGDTPEPARTRAVDETFCRQQLAKTGGTPFACADIRCRVGKGLSLPASALNRMRRDALEALLDAHARRRPIPFSEPSAFIPEKLNMDSPAFYGVFYHPRSIPEDPELFARIYLPLSVPDAQMDALRQMGYRLGTLAPRGLFGQEERVAAGLRARMNAGYPHVLAGNLGAVRLARELGMEAEGDFGLNLFNSRALAQTKALGLSQAMASVELSLADAEDLRGNRKSVMVYGRLPLMLCRACPKKALTGCAGCAGPTVTDRLGTDFPLACDGNTVEILNSVPLYLCDRLQSLQTTSSFFFRFTTESREEARHVMDLAQTGGKPDFPFTRGLSRKGAI